MSDPRSKHEQLWQNSIYISAFLNSVLSQVFRKYRLLTALVLSLVLLVARTAVCQCNVSMLLCYIIQIDVTVLRGAKDLGISFNFIVLK